jgi:transcriptional regulator with XRE-family HTH domain
MGIVVNDELLSLVLGYYIKKKRKDKNISQSELGLALGSQPLISLIENGKHLPAADILMGIANKLNDAFLKDVANQIETGSHEFISQLFTESSDILLQILTNYKGKWARVHKDIAQSLSETYYNQGKHEYVRILAKLIINNNSETDILTESYFYLGSSLLYDFNYGEAKKWLEMAEQNVGSHDPLLKTKIYFNLALTYTQTNNQSRAMWYATEALRGISYIQVPTLYAKSWALLGLIEQRSGQVEQAKKSLEKAYEMFSLMEPTVDKARIEINTAEVNYLLGNYSAALEWCKMAQSTAEVVKDSLSIVTSHELSTLVLLKKQLHGEAEENLRVALQLSDELGDNTIKVELYLLASMFLSPIAQKLDYAQRAFDIVKDSNDYIYQALAAERLSELMENTEEKLYYQTFALHCYKKQVMQGSSLPILYFFSGN